MRQKGQKQERKFARNTVLWLKDRKDPTRKLLVLMRDKCFSANLMGIPVNELGEIKIRGEKSIHNSFFFKKTNIWK